jgi:hypothetical protein
VSTIGDEISLTSDDSAPTAGVSPPTTRHLPAGNHHAPAWFDISSLDAPRARRFYRRAMALIAIAHPDHRDRLRHDARRTGLLH